MRTAPELAHCHIIGDGAESPPLDSPRREVALHCCRQKHEDGWPEYQSAQRCGASLRHRSACGARDAQQGQRRRLNGCRPGLRPEAGAGRAGIGGAAAALAGLAVALWAFLPQKSTYLPCTM